MNKPITAGRTRPTHGRDGRAAAERYLEALASEAGTVPEPLRGWWAEYLYKHRRRYLDVLGLLRPEDAAAPVLDMGCVPGQFMGMLSHLGYDVHGADIGPERMGGFWAANGLSVVRADVEREPLPFPADRFGTVLFMEILEHLRVDPIHALREARRVLRPGGRLIVGTPNITPMARVRFLFGTGYQGDPVKEFRKLETLGHMGHIRIYDRAEVRGLLEYAGFEVERCLCLGPRPRGRLARVMRLLHPRKDHFLPFLYAVARKR